MTNIWKTPPGGFTHQALRDRRRSRIQASIAAVVITALGLTAMRAGLLQSEPVSEAEAVAAYRESVDRETRGAEPRNHRPGRRERRAAPAAEDSAGTRSGSTGTDPSASSNDTTRGRSASRSTTTQARPESEPTRPLEGVYSWNVTGYEETSGGMRRELPRESHRIITHEDGGSWVEHHIFSNQKEVWFEMRRSGSTTVTRAVRNRVQFGAIEVDRTVVFDPNVLAARFPFRMNDTWSGEWEGRTEGEYTARVVEHGYIIIEGERVEVWATEIEMKMRGEVEGTVLTRSWLAPDHGLVVKQYQKMSVESGPGGYRTEWTGQVTSLTPAR